MKLKFSIFVLITIQLFSSCNGYKSTTGFIDLNIKLKRVLSDIRAFLPVNMIMTAIDGYLLNSEEFSYDLEACYLNLQGSMNISNKQDFKIHQKECVNNFLNYYSVFEIIKTIMTKFFYESCPEELENVCEERIEKFFTLSKKVDKAIEEFSKNLIEMDEKTKSLHEVFAEIKPTNINRVVLNSILVINQENFYTQLNDVLETKVAELTHEEVTGEKPETQNVKKEVKPNPNAFIADTGLKDDPFQNPDRYFLPDKNPELLEDLHIVFRTDNNTSSILD